MGEWNMEGRPVYEDTLECAIGELAQARDLLRDDGLERHHDRLRQAQARNRQLQAENEALKRRLRLLLRPPAQGSQAPRDILAARIATWVDQTDRPYGYADRLLTDLDTAGYHILTLPDSVTPPA